MKITPISICFLAWSVLAAAQQTPGPTAKPLPPPFDEKADAKVDIKKAIDAAAIDGIRVLVTWGSNDDKGSMQFIESKRAPAVQKAALFSDEYKSVNIHVGHLDKNTDIAKTYGAILKPDALPALTVLDSAGKVIANTNWAALQSDADPAGIDAVKVAAFLKSHQAPAPDAVAPFEATLKQAKKEGKAVFVWFSAPW